MRNSTAVSSPSVTITRSAGDWRDHSAFCFVAGPVRTETFSGGLSPRSPDLIDALSLLEKIEDEIDVEAARTALADPSELPPVPWNELRSARRP